jgi:hypothetical protein
MNRPDPPAPVVAFGQVVILPDGSLGRVWGPMAEGAMVELYRRRPKLGQRKFARMVWADNEEMTVTGGEDFEG